jgi:hypothetical protein
MQTRAMLVTIFYFDYLLQGPSSSGLPHTDFGGRDTVQPLTGLLSTYSVGVEVKTLLLPPSWRPHGPCLL